MTRPQRYTKKPVTIEAMQWTGTLDSYLDVAEWVVDGIRWEGARSTSDFIDEKTGEITTIPLGTTLPNRVKLYVAANDEWLTLEPGEWIIKDKLGYYPCKNEVFTETYRPADPE